MAFLFGKKKGGNREGTPTGPPASVPGPPQPVNTSVNNIAPEGSGPGSPGAPGQPLPQILPQGVRTHQSQDSIEAATQSPRGLQVRTIRPNKPSLVSIAMLPKDEFEGSLV